ncbi:Crp/Fnr family transcriptional regulator [Streptomyces sp. CBMA156]|uniref:Crp/Fnr family transcriptional regulator n=1 Tax=Streptomyces sp. CBMA156 TaxID=1930280 RepID=UPI003983731D
MKNCHNFSAGSPTAANRTARRPGPGASPGPHWTFRQRVGEERWVAFLRGLPRMTRPAGWTPMREGDPGVDVFALLGGLVDVWQSGGGRDWEAEQLITIRGAGDLLGEMAALELTSRTATVRARTECEVVMISGERFRSAEFRREWWNDLLPYVSGRGREGAMILRSGDGAARVARLVLPLLDHAEGAGQPDGPVCLRITQQEVAECLGLGRDTVRRLTSDPPFGGWPKGRGGSLLVTDPEAVRVAAARLGGWHPQAG